MSGSKQVISRVREGFGFIVRIIGSYLGVVSNVLGAMLGILASVLVLCIIVGICVYVKVIPMFTEAREEVFDKLVNMSEEDFIMSEDTVVYDAKGKKVGSVNTGRYTYVSVKKISPYVYNGYIAVEDKRFKTHAGVDVLATLRAGVALLKNNMEITQGGSTITQQVIKNNLLNQKKNFTRKIAEILLAPTVEEKFSKDKIMESYCNSNFYGNRCYGVQAASEYYFGKDCADLEPQEAAVLIGLSNSPSRYDPVANPDNALKKRNSILAIMVREGVISEKEYKVAVKKKLKVLQVAEDGNHENYITSYAIHCAALGLMEKEDFKCKYTFKDKEEYEAYQEKYSDIYSKKCNAIRSGGYRLYTSIDMNKQKQLQKSVNEGLAYSKEKNKETGKYKMQGAAVCVDNTSNYVVAIVGGRGTKDPYNRAYLAARQSGSSIKPLIDYAPGFESGKFSPATMMTDKAIANGPKNSGGGYRGSVRIREAVARSINTIAWQVLDTITPKYGLSFLDKMKFHNLSYIDNDNLALSLGGFTEGVRVVDMAKGYSTLANGGSYSDKTCIRKIEHVSDGTVYKHSEETRQVYSEDAAWLMTDVLKGVFQESYGTGHRLQMANKQICAGKTGTANSGKDVWFCGYTRYYTTVVWAGYDTPRPMPGATGASVTGGIWKKYMDSIHKKLEPLDFDVPNTICLAGYKSNGTIQKGTETAGTRKRTGGKDYFSTLILGEKSDYASNLEEKNYEKTVKRLLRKFEAMALKSMEDYVEFRDTYEELRDMISAIEDDKVRKSYAARAKDKYATLKEDAVDWKKAEAAYYEARQAENALIARKQAEASKRERQNALRKSRVKAAKARIRVLRTYKKQPPNMNKLIAKAKKALDACKGYSEYSSLLRAYKKNVAYIRGLDDHSSKSSIAPAASVQPMQTPQPTMNPVGE